MALSILPKLCLFKFISFCFVHTQLYFTLEQTVLPISVLFLPEEHCSLSPSSSSSQNLPVFDLHQLLLSTSRFLTADPHSNLCHVSRQPNMAAVTEKCEVSQREKRWRPWEN